MTDARTNARLIILEYISVITTSLRRNVSNSKRLVVADVKKAVSVKTKTKTPKSATVVMATSTEVSHSDDI